VPLHLIKLCVGCETVQELVDWHGANRAGQTWIVHTRQTPKRAAELTQGGSLYRVFKGMVLCRQTILDVNTSGEGQASRCQIVLDAQIMLTEPMPRRAFQGWRYLESKDAPADLNLFGEAGGLPQDLAGKLRELGAW
jgi:hypothetical protein